MTYILGESEFHFEPTKIVEYVDKFQCWVQHPLNATEIEQLATANGGRPPHIRNQPMPFRPSFRQRIQLDQPTRQALEFLARRGNMFVNYVERARDYIFDTDGERDDAFAFVCAFNVKKYHRAQGVRFVGKHGKTRYTGPRRARMS